MGSVVTYDSKNRLSSARNIEGGEVGFSYDEFDNLIKVVDPRGIVTKYSFDGYGQIIKEESAERGITRYKYDGAGNLVKEIREGGLVIKREYDELNRIKREVFKEKGVDRKVNKFTYDNCKNGLTRLCILNSDGHISRYSYNAIGQQTKIETKEIDKNNFEAVNFTYGLNGRLETLSYPTDLKVRFRYGESETVTRVVGWYGEENNKNKFIIAKDIQIDAATGQLLSVTHGNDIKTKYSYSQDGLVDKISSRKTGGFVDKRNYKYNAANKVTNILRSEKSLSQTFTYTDLGRIKSEQRGNELPIIYSYDSLGNRIARKKGGDYSDYAYDTLSNKLASVNGKRSNFDQRGNLIVDRQGKRAFTYDVTNRMSAFYKNGKLKATYRYNALGQRVMKTAIHSKASSEQYKTLNFVYAPSGQLLSEIGRRNDKAHVYTDEYVWLGAIPLAKLSRKIKPDGTTRKASLIFMHTDHLGTPRQASNGTGEIVWSWEGDAFGAGDANNDPDGDREKTNIRLRFAGQYYDSESGLHYNHYRDYDPKLGRYIQSDPIGLWDGLNRYNYVKGNPISAIDPTGESLLYEQCETTQIYQPGHGWVEGSEITTCTPVFVINDGSSYIDAFNTSCGSQACADAPDDVELEVDLFGELTSCSNTSMQGRMNQQAVALRDSLVNLENQDGNEHAYVMVFTSDGLTAVGPITSNSNLSISTEDVIQAIEQYRENGFIAGVIHNHPSVDRFNDAQNFYASPGDLLSDNVLASNGFNISASFSHYVVGPNTMSNGTRTLSLFREGSGKVFNNTAVITCNVTI